MSNALDAVIEIFTWVGLGGGAVLALVAVVLLLADGTWVPVRAVVEDVDGGRVVRWFDDQGGVNEAPLSPHDDAKIGSADMADIFFRRGSVHRMRLTRSSPVVRFVSLLAAGILGLGVVAFILSIVVLFARG
ncbi:MAG: leucyl-tRNA synthetase [Microbacterium sp.]|nr:leucyl-tRNA synthetase [Microbacterium sp.]